MNRAVELLLVEDNAADIKLTSKLLGEVKSSHHLNVVRNGQEALEYLSKAEPFQTAKLPDLILLDLNLPKMDGRELLKQIKAEPALKKIPVIVLTTSGAEADIQMSYDLQANCYIRKPVGLSEFRHVISLIEAFWMGIVELPSAPPER